MVGQLLGHYRIESVLGAGGMGVVYRAHDTRLDRPVAIKVLTGLTLDRTPREALMFEARAASALNHPSICTIYEVGETDERLFLVMELVEGRSLQDVIPPEGLPLDTAVRYAIHVASAVAHAHEHGVVHRDLKSANIRITPDGRIKVLDFGLATRALDLSIDAATRSHQAATPASTVVGTLAYMAPEVLRGEMADARSDNWAQGVLLYEMVTGRLPFTGRSAFELTTAILRDLPPPLDDRCPPAVARIVSRSLEKEPGRRYQRSSELAAALEAVRPQLGHAPGTPIDAAGKTKPRRSHARPWLVVAVCALVISALFVWREIRSPPDVPPSVGAPAEPMASRAASGRRGHAVSIQRVGCQRIPWAARDRCPHGGPPALPCPQRRAVGNDDGH